MQIIEKWKNTKVINKFRVIFIVLMQIAFVVAFFIALYEKRWLTLFVSLVAIGVVWLPALLEKNLKGHVPLEFEFLLNLFIYSSIFLGEIKGYYTKFWWWDIVLHTGAGVALGFIGFLILFSLHQSKKLQIPPFLLALFSFCFALALGALWEIFEFTMDSLFGFNMQKTGLVDTMWDLIVNTIGAGIASLSGYFYLRYGWKGVGVFENHLNTFFQKTKL